MRSETLESERRNGPVVALDVDGVLNVEGRPEDLGPGWMAHDLEVPAADVQDSPFIAGHGEYPISLPVVINPELHGKWIAELRERAEVVWATTWEGAANVHLAPLLGIDPLPVGLSIAVDRPRFGVARDGDTAMWKAMALSRRYSGRPHVWIDDGNEPFAHSFPGRRRKTLVITTDPWFGLTKEQMREVNAFVSKHQQRPSGGLIDPPSATVPYAPSFVVTESLDDLKGPSRGEVALPNRLLWNRSRPFNLSNDERLRSMIRVVLREARSQDDLARFVDRDSLVRLWAQLGLPERIQRAWEERFPELVANEDC